MQTGHTYSPTFYIPYAFKFYSFGSLRSSHQQQSRQLSPADSTERLVSHLQTEWRHLQESAMFISWNRNLLLLYIREILSKKLLSRSDYKIILW
jgi:hypothetical protein